MRDLPPLSALKAFEAVARLGSVSRAAEELGRTHGAVSKQIRLLQDLLGAPLFDKAGTGLVPNAAGKALAASAAEGLDRLEAGWRAAAAGARAPALHVACSATFAMRWLVPHMGAFSREHPQVRLRLSMTSAREMRGEGADLTLAWDLARFPPEEQARAIPVAEAAFGPVAAPGYPVRSDGETLVTACRIDHDFTTRAWDRWLELNGRTIAAAAHLSFPHSHLCLEAAVSALGAAMVEKRLAAAELAAGRLVAPFGFTTFPQGYAAIPKLGLLAPQAVSFLHWLRNEMATDDIGAQF